MTAGSASTREECAWRPTCTTRRPTVDDLLNVRTPSDPAIGPDGTVVFGLHATVSERGVSLPSDLWLPARTAASRDSPRGIGVTDRPCGPPTAHARGSCPTDSCVGTTSRTPWRWAASRSSRQPSGASAEQLLWSSDGSRLLVLVADPWSYGLDWSAVAVTGSEPDPIRIVRRPRRRLAPPASRRPPPPARSTRIGPPGRGVWEVDWDGDDTVVALTSEESGGIGLVPLHRRSLDLGSRTATTPVSADVAARGASRSHPTASVRRSWRATRATTAC